MTIVACGSLYPFPDHSLMGGDATGTIFTFDGSTDLNAVVLHLPATGTISNVHYRISTVTSPLLTLRTEIRTVDLTTGLMNAAGTLYGSSTSITVVNPTTGNKTAAVNCTATAGDLVAIVWDLSAYTSGSFTQCQRLGGTPAFSNFPYQIVNTTGSNVLQQNTMNSFALEYGSHVYYLLEYSCICSAGWVNAGVTVSNSGVTRRGNRFCPIHPMRAVGVRLSGDLDGDVLLRLRLASDDSILATCTVDKDVRGTTASGTGAYFFDSKATVNLAANTDYYVLIEGNSATSSSIYQLTPAEAQQLDQLSGGQACYGTSYNAGYTDVLASRYNIGVLFDGLDDGAGAVASGTFMFGGV